MGNGPAAFFLGSIALAIILFDAGFETRFATLRVAAAPALVLATAGVLVTAVLVGLAARLLYGFAWPESRGRLGLLHCFVPQPGDTTSLIPCDPGCRFRAPR